MGVGMVRTASLFCVGLEFALLGWVGLVGCGAVLGGFGCARG